ncbi:MAG: hypothetical protein KDB22_02725 [Planctomycetales bacterium]|nr:hypothetical protein [Planctomycetales bacterium]
MAVRDRNLFAWQAYVITMTIVSVGLLLGMFFLWRSASDLAAKNDSTNERLQQATSEFQTAERKIELMRAMIGYGTYSDEEMQEKLTSFASDASMSDVVADYGEAMKFFAPGVVEKNLLKLPTYLMETLRARNADIEAARQKVNDLTAKLKATVDSETAARVDAETKLKEAMNDLETARQEHATAMAAVNKERLNTIDMFDQYKKKLDGELNQVKTQLATVEADNSSLMVKNEDLQDQLNKVNEPDFASPQGKILSVQNGGTRVWLNLGSADGLRVGVPFNVLDESSVVISNAEPKANIRVTRVVDEHLSEARVEDPDFRNIILTGDLVYSTAWRPGRKVGFALVGLMDINDDGKDDIDQVRELIKLAGGTIDAERTSKGAEVKNPGIDHNTSWLVMGTDLTLPANATAEMREEQLEKQKNYEDFIKVARLNGVQQISLDKLMGYLKASSSDRTIPLGDRLQGSAFPIRPEVTPPASRGSVSEIFKPRSPAR